MKKLISLLGVAIMASSVFATTATERKAAIENLPTRHSAQVSQRPDNSLDLTAIRPEMQKQVAELNLNAAKTPMKAKAETAETKLQAFYYLPTGAYYLGIDKNLDIIWEMFPGVVGSCLNGNETWNWPAYPQGATGLGYKTEYDRDYPKEYGAGWSMDTKGTFIDSMAAGNFGNLSAYVSYRMPLQTATDGTNYDYFYLVGPGTTRIDTALNFGATTIAGMFNPIAEDGMWPMTNAIFSTPKYGNGVMAIWKVDDKKNVSYIYGTEPVVLPTFDTTYVDETKEEIAKIDTIYNDTVQASAIISTFAKPMGPLYIKEVTVAIVNAEVVTGKSGKDSVIFTDVKDFESLEMRLITAKGVVADVIATKDDTTSMVNIPGQLVTFKIQSKTPYGTIIEGITLNEPFQIGILGFNNPKNKFGVWSAYSPYMAGYQSSVYDTKGEIRQYAAVDPFIMANGMYYTMEHALRTPYIWTTPASYISDTINIKVGIEEDEYYVVHADGPWVDEWPALRAVELLYDTISYKYNYNINAPAWANLDMDGYDYILWEGYDYTWWSYFNCYWLVIWGDATDTSVDAPQVGDEIKLERYGRQLVFKVVEVEEPQSINNVVRTVNDNKLYNVLGIEVDKDYKGVVIRNGEKFLQR